MKYASAEEAKIEFGKIQDGVDLSQWAEYLYDSKLLDESEQVDGISPWDVPACAKIVWDNGENVLVEFGEGDFCLWDNSSREWNYTVGEDDNPLYKDLAEKLRNGRVTVTAIDSNEDFRSNGWINIDVALSDGTVVNAGFWYKTPFRDREPYQAADDSPRESTGNGNFEGAGDIDLCGYGMGEIQASIALPALYDEDHIKDAWELSDETPGYAEAYDALIEKIRDRLMAELEKAEDWADIEGFLPCE